MSEGAQSVPKPKPRVAFLDRQSYRQRRFRDGARMIPAFAAILMALPLMWPRATPDQSLTSSGMIYLFGLWVVLIGVSFGLSRVLELRDDAEDEGAGE